MTVTTTDEPTPAATTEPDVPTAASAPSTLIVEDLLVEDVSIDGMCGVY